MHIDKNFDIPNPLYLMQVSDHCPRALSTYIKIWGDKDQNSKLTIYKRSIRDRYLNSLTKFRTDLFCLVQEGLISVDESPKLITIEFVDFDEFYDEQNSPA